MVTKGIKNMKIYLAGPDVFLPDAILVGQRKKDLCEKYGFVGLYPMDNAIDFADKAPCDIGVEIYQANIALMDKADCIVANITPYHGVSCDIGTGFEIGYMRGAKKPVYAYSNVAEPFFKRQKSVFSHYIDSKNRVRDSHTHMAFENFDLMDNLMLDGAVWDTHQGTVFTADTTAQDIQYTYTRLDIFESVLQYIQSLI